MNESVMNLNRRAAGLVEKLVADAAELRITTSLLGGGTRIVDLGINTSGGLAAGIRLAEICLAGLGNVALCPSPMESWQGPAVQVFTDHPVASCMGSQYAGWEVRHDDFFAMGSGPMRAAAAREELFSVLGCGEQADVAVGILETRQMPTVEVCRLLASQSGVADDQLTLLVAPTASQAGTIQIVARTVETALHKMMELGFDLTQIEGGYGIAPLPPVAGDDLSAIGRTNDAILYGGEVTLWIRGSDDELAEIGPRVPSNSSPDHGSPFCEIFERYGHDFYQVDPQLFSPATVTLVNLKTGRTFSFGQTLPEILKQSFHG